MAKRRIGRSFKKSKSKLGNAVRQKRLELGLTQQKLADMVEVTKAYISLIEIGESAKLSESHILPALARALGFNAWYLRKLAEPRKKYKISPREISGTSVFGNTVRKKRGEFQLTLEKLSLMSGVHKNTISKIEREGIRVKTETFLKIENALNSKSQAGISADRLS